MVLTKQLSNVSWQTEGVLSVNIYIYGNIWENKTYSYPPVKQLMGPTCCVNRKQLLIYVSQYRSSSQVFNWIHLLMLHSAVQVYNLATQQAPHSQDNRLGYQ